MINQCFDKGSSRPDEPGRLTFKLFFTPKQLYKDEITLYDCCLLKVVAFNFKINLITWYNKIKVSKRRNIKLLSVKNR